MTPPASTSDGPPPDSLVELGQIFRPHGVRGELKMAPAADDPTRIEAIDTVYVGPDARRVTAYAVVSVRYQETKRGTTVILKLEGIADRGDAEVITKQYIFASEAELPPLEDDELFVHELIGLAVVTEDGTPVGTLANVLDLPAHDTLVVRTPAGGERLIPAVEDFVVAIDLDAGQIVIRPIEGLLD